MAIQRIDNVSPEVRRLVLTTGDVLELRYEEQSVSVFAGGEQVGSVEFRLYDTPSSPYEDMTVCRLTSAFIEGHGGKYQGQGVGTEAVRLYLECTGHDLELPENDGIQKSDGSHLVNAGPAFVASLRRKKERGEL
jgi:hypothetical protein